MRLYVPEIGDAIRLTQPWTFDLHDEYRNNTLIEKLGVQDKLRGGIDPAAARYRNATNVAKHSLAVTIPVDTVLKIDRVYIRKGLQDFSSLTFLWVGERLPAMSESYTDYQNKVQMRKIPARPIRFWAKLEDVNQIECEPLPPAA